MNSPSGIPFRNRQLPPDPGEFSLDINAQRVVEKAAMNAGSIAGCYIAPGNGVILHCCVDAASLAVDVKQKFICYTEKGEFSFHCRGNNSKENLDHFGL